MNPMEQVTFLGFFVIYNDMSVSMVHDKALKVQASCTQLFQNKVSTIRLVAQMLELFISTFPAVMFGPLYYRQIENEKIMVLKCE